MDMFDFSKALSIGKRGVFAPMLFASLGLHGILLVLPFGLQEVAPDDPEIAEEDVIALTQLSTGVEGAEDFAVDDEFTPLDDPPFTPDPVVPAQSRQTQAPPPQTPRSTQSSPPASPASEQTSAAPAGGAAAATDDPFAAAFPQYPGAEPGSFGLPDAYNPFSYRTTDPLSTVASWYQRELQTKGFSLEVRERSADTGREVYRLSLEGATRYLSLIPNQEGAGTNYVLSEQSLPSDLGSRRVITVEEQQFISDLVLIIPPPSGRSDDPWQEFDPRQLAQPQAFYNLSGVNLDQGDIPPPKNGIERSVLRIGYTNPQALYNERLSNQLNIADFQVGVASSYGGGLYYPISRDGVTMYLSLVPTLQGNSVVVFIWSRQPQ